MYIVMVCDVKVQKVQFSYWHRGIKIAIIHNGCDFIAPLALIILPQFLITVALYRSLKIPCDMIMKFNGKC